MAAKVFFPGDNDAATGVLLATTGPSCGLSATTQSSSSLGFLTEHSKSKNSAQEDEINPPNNDNDPNKFDRSTKIITFRYEPRLGDEVLGIVRKKGPADSFKIDLGNGLSAKLQNSAFNGATLRNKPDISVGDFVFAKVSFVDKDLGIEISCVEDANVQTWSSGACFYQMLDREDGEMVEKFSAGRNAPERVFILILNVPARLNRILVPPVEDKL